VAASSTPSATTVIPSAAPRPMMASTSAASTPPSSIAATNEISIFNPSIGNVRRLPSEEKPVPKSSKATPHPAERRIRSHSIASGPPSSTRLSVISRSSTAGFSPAPRSAPRTSPTILLSRS